MSTYAPGDVLLLFFPFSSTEAQPWKKRPVLVLADQGSGEDRAILVAMITSVAKRWERPGTYGVRLSSWEDVPLHRRSMVRANRLWTAEQRDIERRLGSVASSDLAHVLAKVRGLLEGRPG